MRLTVALIHPLRPYDEKVSVSARLVDKAEMKSTNDSIFWPEEVVIPNPWYQCLLPFLLRLPYDTVDCSIHLLFISELSARLAGLSDLGGWRRCTGTA